MASSSDWYQQYLRQQEENRRRGQAIADYLLPALAFLGVARVTVAFDGYGDDGEFRDPVVEGMPPEGLPEGLLRLVEEVCEYQLPGGWEINGGSFGSFRFDVPAGKVVLDQTWREEEEDEDEGEDEE